MDADGAMGLDDLALDAIALPAVSSAAHDTCPSPEARALPTVLSSGCKWCVDAPFAVYWGLNLLRASSRACNFFIADHFLFARSICDRAFFSIKALFCARAVADELAQFLVPVAHDW